MFETNTLGLSLCPHSHVQNRCAVSTHLFNLGGRLSCSTELECCVQQTWFSSQRQLLVGLKVSRMQYVQDLTTNHCFCLPFVKFLSTNMFSSLQFAYDARIVVKIHAKRSASKVPARGLNLQPRFARLMQLSCWPQASALPDLIFIKTNRHVRVTTDPKVVDRTSGLL